MKAIVYTKYGPPDVLHLKEVAKPVPKDNEVLIKVFAAAVATEDSRWRSFTFPAWVWLALRVIASPLDLATITFPEIKEVNV